MAQGIKGTTSDRKCEYAGCSRVHYGRGWCKLHYDRWRITGTPDPRPVVPVAVRFLARVNPDGLIPPHAPDLGPCHVWDNPTHRFGYGEFMDKQESHYAHVWGWRLFVGPIPKGMEVCHRCDNPSCVRIEHLFLGTHADNMADMARKGRAGTAKLDPDKVRTIRRTMADGSRSARELAEEFGVTSALIHMVNKRQGWKHVA